MNIKIICARISLVFFLAGLEVNLAKADSNVVQCPVSISVYNTAVLPSDKWERGRREKEGESEHAFSAIVFTEGHPDEKAFLRPSEIVKKNGRKIDIFDLSSVIKDIWIVCFYEKTPAYLTQKLRWKALRCEAERGVGGDNAALCPIRSDEF